MKDGYLTIEEAVRGIRMAMEETSYQRSARKTTRLSIVCRRDKVMEMDCRITLLTPGYKQARQ